MHCLTLIATLARVAVEMGGVPLHEFEHPDRALYLLGAEDTGRTATVVHAFRVCGVVASHEVLALLSLRKFSQPILR